MERHQIGDNVFHVHIDHGERAVDKFHIYRARVVEVHETERGFSYLTKRIHKTVSYKEQVFDAWRTYKTFEFAKDVLVAALAGSIKDAVHLELEKEEIHESRTIY